MFCPLFGRLGQHCIGGDQDESRQGKLKKGSRGGCMEKVKKMNRLGFRWTRGPVRRQSGGPAGFESHCLYSLIHPCSFPHRTVFLIWGRLLLSIENNNIVSKLWLVSWVETQICPKEGMESSLFCIPCATRFISYQQMALFSRNTFPSSLLNKKIRRSGPSSVFGGPSFDLFVSFSLLHQSLLTSSIPSPSCLWDYWTVCLRWSSWLKHVCFTPPRSPVPAFSRTKRRWPGKRSLFFTLCATLSPPSRSFLFFFPPWTFSHSTFRRDMLQKEMKNDMIEPHSV